LAELTNGGFEVAGVGVGQAASWDMLSITAGSGSTLVESFESDWGNSELELDGVVYEFGGSLTTDSFERYWGPADGTDDTLMSEVVPPGLYDENTSWRDVLTTVGAGPALESFEDASWGTTNWTTELDDLDTIASDVESFDIGWNNDTFEDEIIDGDNGVLASFYVFEPQDYESFERYIDGHVLVDILTDPPPAGDYIIEINGISFSFAAEVGDDLDDVANGLINVIDTSTYPYSASYYTGSIVVLKNETDGPMLVKVSGPVGDGSEIAIVNADINVNFWLEPLLEP
jgi:hypothetical protein